MDERVRGHDIIVIGASSGGVDALITLIPQLPAELRAAVFIVQHVGPASHLAAILGGKSALPVHSAKAGDLINQGHVYVAPPGGHLMLHDGHMMVRKGPRENMARPAIDPLFRSAAITYGGRVIGVILSGSLNDGTAGLRAIKRCGGLAVVQDTNDAIVPSMPESAIRYVEVDHISRIADMARLLTRLTGEAAGRTPEIPFDIRLETMIAAQDISDMETEDKLGDPSPFTCPDCGGALWEIKDGDFLRYRCHVGHAFTGDAVLTGRAKEIEYMLGGLQRANRERAVLARRMAKQVRQRDNGSLADLLTARAEEYDQNAEVVRRLSSYGNGEGLAEEQEGQEGEPGLTKGSAQKV